MIEVKNISKKFGDREVLKDISLKFDAGKTNLIIGASGSGKTTIVKCIVGLEKPDTGDIFYDRDNFLNLSFNDQKTLRKQIGYLFQGSALFDSMNVEQNIIFPLQMFSEMSKSEMQDRANFCLERVNLKNTNKLFPSELSGGMKKRVGIARAIAGNPKYLFCDEPNSGLDPQTSVVIDELINEITHEFNMTTIVITHDMNSVLAIGEKIFFFLEGRKKWEGTKNEILETKDQDLSDFIYASSFLKELKNKSKF